MEQKNNVFKRIVGVYLRPRETFNEISTTPTSWKYIFLMLVGLVTLLLVYLVQVPSGVTSILIGASVFPVYLICLIFFGVMVVFSLIYFIILYLIYFIGTRLGKSRENHRSKKVIFNIYIYSLTPLLLLVTQIPFIVIFGGYYSLFQLRWFFYILLGLIISWHVFLLYRGIQANSEINSQRAKIISGIYIGSICAITGFLIYAVLYINFSISWIGLLA